MGLPATTTPRYTVAEYLRREIDALDRHEYRDGEILLMSGGSPEHSLILANVIAVLHGKLKGQSCRVYDSNLRIRVPQSVLYTYPDASVICGPVNRDPNDASGQTVTNPRVLVEVLSPTTESYDRGEKFDRYRRIESLEEYVLISQSTARVETFFRQDGGTWLLTPTSGLDAVAKLRSLPVELPLADVYAGVELPPAVDPPDGRF